MIGRFLPVVALCLATACGGGPSTPQTPKVDPHALMYSGVETVAALWSAAASACISAAEQSGDDSIRQKCADVLLPAHDTILAAADAVDTWTLADQNNLPCLLKSAAAAVTQAAALPFMPPGTARLRDGLALAGALSATCTATDGGAR